MTLAEEINGTFESGDPRMKGFSQETFNMLFNVMSTTGLRLQITKVVNGRAALLAFTPTASRKNRKYKRTTLATNINEHEMRLVLDVIDKFEVIDAQKDPDRSWQDVTEDDAKRY